MSDGFFMTFKECKCGQTIGCMAGDGTEDGDIIKHDNCKEAQKPRSVPEVKK